MILIEHTVDVRCLFDKSFLLQNCQAQKTAKETNNQLARMSDFIEACSPSDFLKLERAQRWISNPGPSKSHIVAKLSTVSITS